MESLKIPFLRESAGDWIAIRVMMKPAFAYRGAWVMRDVCRENTFPVTEESSGLLGCWHFPYHDIKGLESYMLVIMLPSEDISPCHGLCGFSNHHHQDILAPLGYNQALPTIST
jgi:hypothetical protein